MTQNISWLILYFVENVKNRNDGCAPLPHEHVLYFTFFFKKTLNKKRFYRLFSCYFFESVFWCCHSSGPAKDSGSCPPECRFVHCGSGQWAPSSLSVREDSENIFSGIGPIVGQIGRQTFAFDLSIHKSCSHKRLLPCHFSYNMIFLLLFPKSKISNFKNKM